MIGKQYALAQYAFVIARCLTEQLPQPLPGITRGRRRGLRHRIAVEARIEPRVIRRMHQGDYWLSRPRLRSAWFLAPLRTRENQPFDPFAPDRDLSVRPIPPRTPSCPEGGPA